MAVIYYVYIAENTVNNPQMNIILWWHRNSYDITFKCFLFYAITICVAPFIYIVVTLKECEEQL